MIEMLHRDHFQPVVGTLMFVVNKLGNFLRVVATNMTVKVVNTRLGLVVEGTLMVLFLDTTMLVGN